MTWFPTSGLPFQYQKANTGFANEYRMKFYQAGTSTPINAAFNRTATDELGNPLEVETIRLNEFGYTVNNSGGVCIPHVEVEYKVVLYKNETDANANDTNKADYVVDFCRPGLIGFVESGGQNNSALISYLADPTAVSTTVEARLRRYVDVLDFGAVGNGSTNDTIAIASALAASSNVYFPGGRTYLIDGIEIVSDSKACHFDSGVVLEASANNVVLFHQQSSFSRHTGSFTAKADNRSNVWGMLVGPADITNITNTSTTIRNQLPGIYGSTSTDAVAELVVLQNGPTSGSFCNYNQFPFVSGSSDLRAIWIKSPALSSSPSITHNNFYSVRARGNTGVQIDCGRYNTFFGVHLNGLANGTSPNSTPTGVKILDACPVTSDTNLENRLYGVTFVGCTRDIDLGNAENYIEGDPNLNNSVYDVDTPAHQLSLWGANSQYEAVGKIAASGTALSLPNGWTSVSLGGGSYRITHNLGSSNYVVCANVMTSGTTNNVNLTVFNLTSNSFDARQNVNSSSSTDQLVWGFILRRF